jgi:hypothetical protein
MTGEIKVYTDAQYALAIKAFESDIRALLISGLFELDEGKAVVHKHNGQIQRVFLDFPSFIRLSPQ